MSNVGGGWKKVLCHLKEMNTRSRMASGLSFDHGCDRDSIALPFRDSRLGGLCTSTLDSSDPEAVLRNLFDQINMGDGGSERGNSSYGLMRGGLGVKIVHGPSPNLISVEFSDVLTSFIHRLCGHGNEADSRKNIEELLCKILNEKLANLKSKSEVDDARSLQVGRGGASCSSVTASNAREGSPLRMLKRLKEVALRPWNLTGSGVEQESQAWSCMMLTTRRILSTTTQHNMNEEEFPYVKRQKFRHNPCETSRASSIFHSKDLVGHMKDNRPKLNLSKRKSKRILGQVKLDEGHLPRKRIPIGTSFQADVPEWNGQSLSCYANSSDLRWVGTRIWPAEFCNIKAGEGLIGRGRPNVCSCHSPSSSACNKYHLRKARHCLHRELRQAFYEMGFDNMGEIVANSWSLDEQLKFENLVRTNPISEDKTFFYPALKFFPSKSREIIVSYYYNVHTLRRMSYRTRMPEIDVDSDDDECGGSTYTIQNSYLYTHPHGRLHGYQGST